MLDRQTDEDADALVEHAERVGEGEVPLRLGALGLAGSGRPQCAVIGWPGQIGQTSFAASSQTVNTKSSFGASWLANSSQDFERSFETSKFDLAQQVAAPAD